MPIEDYAEYVAAESRGIKSFAPFTSISQQGPLVPSSLYRQMIVSGIPTTAVALDARTATGNQAKQHFNHDSVGFFNDGRERYITRVKPQKDATGTTSSADASSILFIDRLSETGGLVCNVNTEQETNLPTAALTRYTSGEGVFAALEIYIATGATAVNATIKYTNQAGTPNRVSKPHAFGNGNNTIGHGQVFSFIVMALQDGDTGVRSVESVTLSATTGAAGNFGVVLFKPLFITPVSSHNSYGQKFFEFNPLIGCGGALPRIYDGAFITGVLRSMVRATSSTALLDITTYEVPA